MAKRTACYRIYNPAGYFMGAAVYQEDAAHWASSLGAGATIRTGRTKKSTLYTIPEDGEVDYCFDNGNTTTAWVGEET